MAWRLSDQRPALLSLSHLSIYTLSLSFLLFASLLYEQISGFDLWILDFFFSPAVMEAVSSSKFSPSNIFCRLSVGVFQHSTLKSNLASQINTGLTHTNDIIRHTIWLGWCIFGLWQLILSKRFSHTYDSFIYSCSVKSFLLSSEVLEVSNVINTLLLLDVTLTVITNDYFVTTGVSRLLAQTISWTNAFVRMNYASKYTNICSRFKNTRMLL